MVAAIQPGLAIIHANRLETLRDLMVQWMARQPVPPLAQEQILVQSNGIAQWLKMALAETADNHPGIAAGLRVELPNQFVWRLYRAVLGERIPTSLPYDKDNLSWRILRLLKDLNDDVYVPIERYLRADEDGRKAYYLAQRLADLYDQYQVYRADWLQLWSDGNDVLLDGQGRQQPLPQEQRWQAALWRLLRDDMATLAAPSQFSSRADVHTQALAALQQGQIEQPQSLPPRIVVFGISTLPQSTLELLAALAQHRQVLLAVLNPCRWHWGDISTHKDEVRRWRKRQQRKPGLPQPLQSELLHLHAPQLLASLGKQARDYIALLDQFDQPEHYQDWFEGRIDLFSEPQSAIDSLPLLQRIQDDILELRGPAEQKLTLSAGDTSLRFQVAHSVQREVEILQDQLLADFAADDQLRPRDVIVMMPDIASYSASIHAVFGRIGRDDPRYLPYTLADQALRGEVPLLIALEYLLYLPEQRLSASEVVDLLDVPAIQRRFKLNPEILPQLRLWLAESGVRWGLDSEHRQQVGIATMGDSYSWQFGIERLLLGYAMGDTNNAWHDRAPYADIGGLAAADLGPVLALVDQLGQWYRSLSQQSERLVSDWQQLLNGENGLLQSFFDFSDEHDSRHQARLLDAMQALADAAAAGHYQQALPLSVMREAWLSMTDQAGLSQRFMAGSMTFSTLLPMRAIPFKRIYMLGMNDGDYPRTRRPDDFDLMALHYRSGDRSRRDDDRYLFLEALLSARQALSISWLGRNVRDNSVLPPSVLVSQLLDVVDQNWQTADGEKASASLVNEYPLQPFSRQYFTQGGPRTYAHEWQRVHSATTTPPSAQGIAALTESQLPELNLQALRELLRHPVQYFLQQRLGARPARQDIVLLDQEPFALDELDYYLLGSDLLRRLLLQQQGSVAEALQQLQREGCLPLQGLGDISLARLQSRVAAVWQRLQSDDQGWQLLTQPLDLDLSLDGLRLQDRLDDCYQNRQQRLALLQLRPAAVTDKGQPRWHTLRDARLSQLLANASGAPLTAIQYGTDDKIVLTDFTQQQALQRLNSMVAVWRESLQQPLPLAPKTAFAWLTSGDQRLAQRVYEGDYQRSGEGQQDQRLQRYFPSFQALWEAGFADYADRLYGPLLDEQVRDDQARDDQARADKAANGEYSA
ncbi:exodeoxyribonuclease V subunit gamma [Idiomarina xiamenensis]|uniref:RecBCD enzyme subunit RecC n=1 Tax=Idiomarina xiamenensis 10-D-4 TaxID=740709 RepID=K2JLR6_9GAMM|nr:exodeoxyribonuclease V subunit gamma [Idiomarina xiamenensis]EKE84446.1 exodeoxyribonuclease V subunit gamma [Idiomarina xiamenensis 10-D-4]